MTPTQQHLVNTGRLIEAGWLDLRSTMPPDANLEWIENMRTAYFAGARFLFKQIVQAARTTEGGVSPVSLDKINQELEYFISENMLKHAPIAGNA